jgi:hypothetical protein
VPNATQAAARHASTANHVCGTWQPTQQKGLLSSQGEGYQQAALVGSQWSVVSWFFAVFGLALDLKFWDSDLIRLSNQRRKAEGQRPLTTNYGRLTSELTVWDEQPYDVLDVDY